MFKDNFAVKSDRNKAIKLLKAARVIIENRTEKWVCSAISEAARKHIRTLPFKDSPGVAYTNRIKDRLRNNIRKSLNGCSFVTEWLNQQGINSILVYTYARQYRLLWIDSMIADLEAMNV